MRILFVLISASMLVAQADRASLKDGSVLTGSLQKADAGGITFLPAGEATPRRLAWPDLRAPGVESAGAIALGLANGDRVTARVLGLEGDRLRLETALLGAALVPITALEPAAPPPSSPAAAPEKSPEAELGETLKVFDPKPWKGRIGLTGAFRTGNVDAMLFRFDLGAEKLWARDRFKAAGDASYGETDGTLTAENAKATAKLDHYFTKPFYVYGLGETGFDKIQNLNLRALLGIGAGYELWHEGNDRNLGFEAGINGLYQDFEGGTSNLSPAGRGAFFFRDLFFEKLKIEEMAEVLVPLDDAGRYLARSTTTLTMPIAEGWSFKNILEIQYQGDPPQNTDNLDLKLLVGIEYAF